MPKPPPGLADFAHHVQASNAPAICIIDRELIRDLLAYLRALEIELAGASGDPVSPLAHVSQKV